MQKNKFTTYLLYAISEIFLVVIGILIGKIWQEFENKYDLAVKNADL